MKEKKSINDIVGQRVYILYLICLVIAIGLIARVANIQIHFVPDKEIESIVTPKLETKVLDPERGNILAQDGRLLAMTVPNFTVYMDCAVLKEEFAQNGKKGIEEEARWMEKARGLSEGLAAVLGDRTAAQYYSLIKNSREANRRYVKICEDIDLPTYNRLIKLPLFNEPSHKGGRLDEKEMIRVYPYGTLARRTIGFVRSNKSTVGNTHVGIEGKFDFILHGEEGFEHERVADNSSRVRDYSKEYKSAVDGNDIRTTLNIDYQDIADKALRSKIENEYDIEGGCLVLMEVKTGAIRAMVNLLRDPKTGRLEESQNLAIGRKGEPGSVFKTVTLTSAVSDGYIKTLDEKIPTNKGVVPNTTLKVDDHIARLDKKEISILDGFKISSNYVFAMVAIDHYWNNPQKFIDNIYMYRLGEAFDFDLVGLASPTIPSPSSSSWSRTTLGTVGYGYGTEETPLHILTFYNALAGKGKMMKPYLVEDIEKNGIVIEKRGPSVLNASICSKATADTVARALAAVTEEGTATRLKNAKYHVAGKTGTSFATFESGAMPGDPYRSIDGKRKYQGTFVGFFPTESPVFSIICVVYSKPTDKSFQGGGLPAEAVRDVVDNLHVFSPHPDSVKVIKKTGKMPVMKSSATAYAKGEVPDVMGMGLKDAIYLIENSGFKCSYTGSGHVTSQEQEDDIIKITLE